MSHFDLSTEKLISSSAFYSFVMMFLLAGLGVSIVLTSLFSWGFFFGYLVFFVPVFGFCSFCLFSYLVELGKRSTKEKEEEKNANKD